MTHGEVSILNTSKKQVLTWKLICCFHNIICDGLFLLLILGVSVNKILDAPIFDLHSWWTSITIEWFYADPQELSGSVRSCSLFYFSVRSVSKVFDLPIPSLLPLNLLLMVTFLIQFDCVWMLLPVTCHRDNWRLFLFESARGLKDRSAHANSAHVKKKTFLENKNKKKWKKFLVCLLFYRLCTS